MAALLPLSAVVAHASQTDPIEKYQGLIEREPFRARLPGSPEQEHATSDPQQLRFNGTVDLDGRVLVGIEDVTQKRGYIFTIGQSQDGIEIQSIDENEQTVTLTRDGKTMTLALEQKPSANSATITQPASAQPGSASASLGAQSTAERIAEGVERVKQWEADRNEQSKQAAALHAVASAPPIGPGSSASADALALQPGTSATSPNAAQPASNPSPYLFTTFANGMENVRDGNWNGAAANLNQVIQANPNYPDAFYWRGQVKQQQGDLSGAAQDFQQAQSLKPPKNP